MIATQTSNFYEFLRSYKWADLVSLTCPQCKKPFQKSRKYIETKFNNFNNCRVISCSRKCRAKMQETFITVSCGHCQKEVRKTQNQFKKSKSGKAFCDRSCAAKYNNTHKSTGTRRSKMEKYFEKRFREDFPELLLLCNSKEQILSELDFFFPEIMFALELNGIFHYEPIYGQDKLERIQASDQQKIIKCAEAGIELCILDISSCKRFTAKSGEKFYLKIKPILDSIRARK